MSVLGVTAGVRAAIAAAITGEGLPCYQYDAWDIPVDDFVTLGAAEWELRDDSDQAYGIRALSIPVMLYSLVDGNAEQSLADQETAFEKILNGLGQDRTLGRKVAHSDIADRVQQFFLRNPNGQTYSVITATLLVMPFPNKGS